MPENKINKHTKSPFQKYPLPECRFSWLNIDIVGPFKSVEGYTHLLTIIDRYTRFPMAIPLKSTTAESVANAFIQNWLPLFGVASYITSDRGANFTSALFTQMAVLLGIKTIKTRAYSPHQNS